ncbi:hypothetical protein [Mucilaginibacter sp. NFX135]|uniref:hypothetical protein n=1 Tax=Mucilaginibacter sp. NFX135 TaxID=3402687 RepID=UPI003AFB668C
MKTEGKKFLLTLLIAFLLLVTTSLIYAWYARKTIKQKKPVAICGKAPVKR